MKDYVTVLGESVGEYSEKRSKFIATVRPCKTESEALAFIEEMRTKYWDARHNVYVFSVDDGNLKRFSDDGEPHGTAGKPMLEVVEGSGLTNIAVVVTRYFGGVLLGTGGLVRAYTEATKRGLELAVRVKMVPCSVFSTTCSYSDHSKLLKLIENNQGVIENTVFEENVNLTYYLENKNVETYLLSLKEAFSATLHAEFKEEKLFGVKI